ncbi:MAG: hypothetical protein COA82_08265 [Alkaliphilus sp.]|nr:MAG: hypothetical protein COA82_08265 [Alkaliphilus sp.]
MEQNKILAAVIGLCIGDALGVPAEFKSREELSKNPIIDMVGYGTYSQPAGTWSDDTSMTLCLLKSLQTGLDYTDIMSNFHKWYRDGEFTPYGEVFDIGIATAKAIERFENNTDVIACGGTDERSNGNGSLMRILPIIFYLRQQLGKDFGRYDEALNIIHNVSKITHAHPRTLIGCAIYCLVANELANERNIDDAIDYALRQITPYYKKRPEFARELKHYTNISSKNLLATPIEEIRSSGYIVDTLKAALWCLQTTITYEACVLKAVNLGNDTDTVAAVAGGLAGLYYGLGNIPSEWIKTIPRIDYIKENCVALFCYLRKKSTNKLCNYIPYFENATEKNVAWSESEDCGESCYTFSYPIYEKKFEEFIEAVYDSNVIDRNYMEIAKNIRMKDSEAVYRMIDSSSTEVVFCILTSIVRAERFGDGAWADAIENKFFLRILKRLEKEY